MYRLLLLAQEEHGGGGLSFGGELRGYLVVVFAIALFCGSIYLLLATDVGARIGFLVAFGALTGFLTMLGLIWFTNLTPLNALHGPAPHWEVKEVVDDLSDSEIGRKVGERGKDLGEAEQGEIKASVDSAVTEEEGAYQLFSKSTDYIATGAEDLGGGNKALFGHDPHYAVMKIQPVKKVEPLPGQAPPPPAPDPSKPAKYVILERDLGSMRQPPLFMSLGFGILFAISLVLLHGAERAKQEAESKGELEPKPAWA